MTDLILAIVAAGSFLLLLVMLYAALGVAELLSPRLSRFLDRYVGPEPEWRRWK